MEEIQQMKISSLPPEIQKQLKAQYITNKINTYGMRTIKIDAKEYLDDKYIGNRDNLFEWDDFKDLEEGCEAWLVGEKYPMRSCLNPTKIGIICGIKKIIPTLILNPLGAIDGVINWRRYLEFMWLGMRNVYMDVNFYSQPVREIYRALSGWSEVVNKIRDVICAILEFDIAYRYRAQDILFKLDKIKLIENPLKELERLFTILISRENWATSGMERFKGIFPLVRIYFMFNPKKLKQLKEILSRIDINEIKLSVEDIYWTNQAYKDYNFRGISYEERRKQYEEEKNQFALQNNK